jgi:hypothetical protein
LAAKPWCFVYDSERGVAFGRSARGSEAGWTGAGDDNVVVQNALRHRK